MRNEADVRDALVAYLAADTAGRCHAIEVRTGLPTPPLNIYGFPAREPEAWPPCFVTGNGTAGFAVVETADEAGDALYERRYRMTAEIWCVVEKHEDYAGVDALRARLEQAVIEALLDDDPGTADHPLPNLAAQSIVVDAQSITSRASDIFEDDEGHQAQAAEIAFEAIAFETLARPLLAAAYDPDDDELDPLEIDTAPEPLEDDA